MITGAKLPLRAAVVGSGGISKEHLSYLSGRCPTVVPDEGLIRLVGVCDLSPVAASYAADQFGAESAYTDLERMLEESRPDVVHVLTPPETHSKLAVLCLESGANVICEKPITSTAPELETLVAAAETHDRFIMESHNYRFNSGIQEILGMISDGTLGQVREVEIRIVLPVTDPETRFGDRNLPSPIHQMPAGVLHDFTTHYAYLVLLLSGGVDFTRLSAAWSNHADIPIFTYDDLDATLIGEGPAGPVHARIRFDAGAAPETFTVRVRGSVGWVETDLFQPYLRTVVPRPGGSQLSPVVNHVVNGASLLRAGVRNVGKKLLQHTPYEGLHRMLDLTYRSLAAGDPPPVSTADMLSASKLVDRLLDDKVRL